MHYVALVAVPETGDLDEQLDKALAPFKERWCESEDCEGDCAICTSGFWDWWVVGGRWTGWLDDYDPDADARNIERCITCGGTGRRTDACRIEAENPGWTARTGGCNGCEGKGVRPVWPSSRVRHPGDVVTPAQWLACDKEHKTPYSFVAGESALHRQTWNGSDFIETPDWEAVVLAGITQLDRMGGFRLAVVDYHC